jgi:hypothetical protein
MESGNRSPNSAEFERKRKSSVPGQESGCGDHAFAQHGNATEIERERAGGHRRGEHCGPDEEIGNVSETAAQEGDSLKRDGQRGDHRHRGNGEE